MIFIKDPNIRYTDMCIYIDNHIYNGDYDEQKVYEYLYHLAYVLAVKQRFFKTTADYENFSLTAATRMLLRLVNKRQFLDDDNPNMLPKIKSVLNYIKKILYPMKVYYQKEYFQQIFNTDYDKLQNENADALRYAFSKQLSDANSRVIRFEFDYYLRKITATIKDFLRETPYSEDKVMSKNIYISCLLSILKAITLSRTNLERYNQRQKSVSTDDDFINAIYKEERETSITLWHLDSSMYNYILVLVNRIYSFIADDLRQLLNSHELSDDLIKAVLSSPLESIMQRNER